MTRRKIIVITARVHAAETMGSFKVEGIIDFLISNRSMAVKLRNLYIFKIVPMLNPEGVISGNFRCSITGVDLNRRWDNPDEILHPQIFYIKNLMKKIIAENKEILVFCDLHGHSRKINSFIYGCNKAANGGFCSWTKVRLLPRIFATKTPMVSYNDCLFRIENSKQRTARVVVWKELGITNSFTFESSFFGYMRGDEISPFDPDKLKALGCSLLESLAEYYYVLKGLEKELELTRGWLKPSRLMEVTGPLASEELAKKIAYEKREHRIQKKIMEMREISMKINEMQRAKLKRKYSVGKTEEEKNSSEIPREKLTTSKSIDNKQKKREHKINENLKLNLVTFDPISKHHGKPTLPSCIYPHTETKAIRRSKTKMHSKGISIDLNGPETSMRDWRNYFENKELEKAYDQIRNGIDPNDVVEENKHETDSDSDPSGDNLDNEEMQNFLSSIPAVCFV